MASAFMRKRPALIFRLKPEATPRQAAARSCSGVFDSSVGMPREPALLAWVHRSARRKRPSAKLRAAIVGKSLLELGSRVHHEWTVLCDGLVDRTTLEKKNFNRSIHSLERHAQ